MMDDIQVFVHRLVGAVARKDRDAWQDALQDAGRFDPGELLAAVADAIADLSGGRSDLGIPSNDFLTDPQRSGILLRAVIEADQAALLAWAPGGYTDLFAGMVALAAALESQDN